MGVLAVFLVVVSVTASQGDLRKGCTADGFYILPSKSKTFSRFLDWCLKVHLWSRKPNHVYSRTVHSFTYSRTRNFNGRSSRYWFERESAAPCDNKMVQIKNDIKYEECFERCYSSECQQVKFEKKSYKDEVGTCIMCPTFQPGNQNTYKRINKSNQWYRWCLLLGRIRSCFLCCHNMHISTTWRSAWVLGSVLRILPQRRFVTHES